MSETKPDPKNKPVYPVIERYFKETNTVKSTPGITLREHYAGLAMQGLCANTEWATSSESSIADSSVSQADALIEELNKTQVDK